MVDGKYYVTPESMSDVRERILRTVEQQGNQKKTIAFPRGGDRLQWGMVDVKVQEFFN